VTEPPETLFDGGHSGVVRAGDTVRRQTGPWTPAVHALLAYLAPRLPNVPQVLGFDGQGREILSYLPGHVVGYGPAAPTEPQITAMARWARQFHDAVAGFWHPGPWRFTAADGATLIGHNDIAPYNVCFDGDRLTGVFDWDLAAPSTPLLELAFMAWNCVPLWRDTGPGAAAARLSALAEGYGGSVPAGQILAAVPGRIELLLDFIPSAAADGDRGMAALIETGEPGISRRALDGLVTRIPAIAARLA